MELKEYQPLARRTLKEMPYPLHVEHMGLGVNGELGEFCDAIKKFFVYGKGVDPATPSKALSVADGGVLDKVNLSEEGGDCFWYVVGYLPELELTTDVLKNGFDEGLQDSIHWKRGANKLITEVQAQVSKATLDLMNEERPDVTTRIACMQIIGRNLGKLYGFFGLNLSDSLDANIAKLAKRYGDKYSDVAALNRDLGAERSTLESNLQPTKLGAVGLRDAK